ncbi:MAG TPA: FG-GAP repeat protein [Planctomycetota bacterium]
MRHFFLSPLLVGAALATAATAAAQQGAPLVSHEHAKLVAPDAGAMDMFGAAVALDRGVALIGTPMDAELGMDAGAAWIFRRGTNAGAWHAEAKLLPADGAEMDMIGHGLALSGNRAATGAMGHDHAGADAGAVHVFAYDAATMTWSQEAELLAADPSAGAMFGFAVAMQGDRLLASAPGSGAAGAVYVFHRDQALGWRQVAKLEPAAGAALGTMVEFGYAVDLSGDHALIGAKGADLGADNTGAAFVFRRTAAGIWQEEALLAPAALKGGDWLGRSVALDGDTALLGSIGAQAVGPSAGAAHVFHRDGASGRWNEAATLVPADHRGGDWHGASVALEGDVALVGSMFDDDNGNASGSAYLYRRDRASGLWTEVCKFLSSDGAQFRTDDWFGNAAALSGNTALVGAFMESSQGIWAGAAYVCDWDVLGVAAMPVRAGLSNLVEVRHARPGQLVHLAFSTAGRGLHYEASLDVSFDLDRPAAAGHARADANGDAAIRVWLPSMLSGRQIWAQAAQWQWKSQVCTVTAR